MTQRDRKKADSRALLANKTPSSGTAPRTIDVVEFIDAQKFSLYQWAILLLCFLVLAVDGFDAAAIGYIAPALVAKWGVSREALGPVMSAALIGLGVGALVAGPIADRIGRKTVLVMSVACFGLWSLVAAQAHSVGTLTALRLLTGLGLGAAMPNAMTLMSEYAPARIRAVVVNVMNCGFSFGLVMGGVRSAWLIPKFGWQSVLVAGGIGPLVLAVLLVTLLPESVQFLVARSNVPARIARILGRIVPGARLDGCNFLTTQADAQPSRDESPFAVLLSRRYRLGTLMLWVGYFMGLLIYYFLTNWLPTLMKDVGLSMRNAALMTSLFPLGGMVGNICVGWVMDRFDGARVIALTYGLTAVLVLVAGRATGYPGALGALLFLCGVLLIGAATSMSALAVTFYPMHGRATGVSWMHGMGRPGGVAGAWVGAALIGMGWSLGTVFSLLAVPALAAAYAMYAMAPRKPHRAFLVHDQPDQAQ